MEFLKDFNSKVEEGKQKLQEFKIEQAADLEKKKKLQAEYEVHISNLIFPEAEKTKSEIKELETRMETREDIMGILQSDQHSGMIKNSIQAAKKYIEERGALVKEAEALEAKALQKRMEYISVLAEVTDHNNFIERMHDVFYRQIYKKDDYVNKSNSPVQWKSPEVLKEIGADMALQQRSNSGIITIGKLLIQNTSVIFEAKAMAETNKARMEIDKRRAEKEKKNASPKK